MYDAEKIGCNFCGMQVPSKLLLAIGNVVLIFSLTQQFDKGYVGGT